MRILLAGQPNCGKTTVFNLLTGGRAPTGNRPGVTVETRQGKIRGTGDVLLDLPGLYALSGGGADEALARQAIGDFAPDLILNVADCTALQRSLMLTFSLCQFGKPMALVLTMGDEGEKQGLKLDISALEGALGIPCLLICARQEGAGEEIKKLLTRGKIPQYVSQWETPVGRGRGAEEIAQRCTVSTGRERKVGADRILCHRVWGLVLFAAIMGLVFCVTFRWAGAYLSEKLSTGIEGVGGWIRGLLPNTLPPLLEGLLGEGLWDSVGAVVSFLPQVWLLYLCLGLLEDCGYLSRVAFLLDTPMGRLGLEGRSAIMLLLGFGCTVPATLATRSLEKQEDREGVMRLLPFVPCSAKLPLTAALAGSLFPKGQGWGFGLLYGLCLVFGLLWGFLGRRGRSRAPLVLELPPYRMPHMKSVWKQAGDRAWGFLLRAGPVLFLSAGALWLLMHLTPTFAYTQEVERSLLYPLARGLCPLLYPLGLKDWRQGVVLLSGVGAKETMGASLYLLYGKGSLPFSFQEALSFGVFALLLPPCVGAVTTMGGELGKRGRWLFVWQILFAYGAAACCYATVIYCAAGTM